MGKPCLPSILQDAGNYRQEWAKQPAPGQMLLSLLMLLFDLILQLLAQNLNFHSHEISASSPSSAYLLKTSKCS